MFSRFLYFSAFQKCGEIQCPTEIASDHTTSEYVDMGFSFWSKIVAKLRKSSKKKKKEPEEPRPSCSFVVKKTAKYAWEKCSDGNVPRDALIIDDDDGLGCPAHVGRVYLKGALVPGMLLPEVGVVGVTPSGALFTEKLNYEALTGDKLLWWPLTKEKSLPYAAVRAGFSRKGNGLYVGRVVIEEVHHVGMVVDRSVLVVRYKEQQVLKFTSFEVLCCL